MGTYTLHAATGPGYRISFNSADEDDLIEISLGAWTVNRFGGNDTIIAWAPERSLIFSGDGDDVIHARNAEIRGGEGNDILYVLPTSNVTFHGESGEDVVDFGDITMSDATVERVPEAGNSFEGLIWYNKTRYDYEWVIAIHVSGVQMGSVKLGDDDHNNVGVLPKASATLKFADGVISEEYLLSMPITHGDTHDLYEGSDTVSETVHGAGGNDRMHTYGGNDTIRGGTGDDMLIGGRGSDVYEYARGDGNDGIHELKAVGDTNVLRLLDIGASEITLTRDGDNLNVTIDDTQHVIVIWGHYRTWAVDPEANGPMLHEIRFADGIVWDRDDIDNLGGPTSPLNQITGTEGNDQLIGTEAGDHIQGLAGNDYLYGNAGADLIEGGDGDDRLYFDALDTISGGEGYDRAFVQGAAGVALDLGAAGIEMAQGNAGADAFDASTATQGVTLRGEGGSDTLTGSAHNDSISGGDGDDTIAGGAGNDYLYGNAGADVIEGGEGNDRIYFDGLDTISGGAGYDRAFVQGTAGVALDLGAAGIEMAQGNAGADAFDASTATQGVTLRGEGGSDILTGSTYNDSISGGDGDDVLAGGAGNDYLYGNAGNDTFLWSSGQGNDRFHDAPGGSNTLVLTDIASDGVSLSRHYDNLHIAILTTGETLRVMDHFADAGGRIQSIQFADGVTWGIPEINGPDESLQDIGPNPVAAPEFQVNTFVSGTQMKPEVVRLTNGNLLYVWQSNDGQQEDKESYAIKARILDQAGQPVVEEFVVNRLSSGAQSSPDVAALANGGFAITWESSSATFSDIRMSVFDAAGTPLVDDILVNSVASDQQIYPAITELTDGRLALSWQSYDVRPYVNIRATILDQEGNRLVPDILVTPSATANQYYTDIQSLADGGFAVVWIAQGGHGIDSASPAVVMRLHDNAGAATTDTILLNTFTSGQQLQPRIARLADGNIVAVWQSQDGQGVDLSGFSVKARIFDPSGQEVFGEFVVNAHFPESQGFPDVAALDDGRFVVVWISREGPAGSSAEWEIRGRIVNADGSMASDEFLVTELTNGVLYFPAVEAAQDGFVVTWRSPVPNGTDTDQSSIHSRFFTFDAPKNEIRGTAQNDTLRGTDAADALFGLDGDDSISGGDGDDDLHGGAGNDYLYGNAGADLIEGGAGDDRIYFDALDTISGGEGYDRAFVQGAAGVALDLGAAGIEMAQGNAGADTFDASTATQGVTLRGEGGADTLTGSAHNDSISGGAGDDVIAGGAGNDYLYGNAGADVIEGGDGDDRLYFDALDTISGGEGYDRAFVQGAAGAALDLGAAGIEMAQGNAGADVLDASTATQAVTLRGEGGSDTLTGSAHNDSISGGDGDDTIAGGAGNDYLYGNAGADLIEGGDGDDRLFGGSGADTFVFKSGFGTDRIMDFEVGDLIDVSSFGFADYAALQSGMSEVGSNVEIDFDDGSTLMLMNQSLVSLSQDDFFLA